MYQEEKKRERKGERKKRKKEKGEKKVNARLRKNKPTNVTCKSYRRLTKERDCSKARL
jgi:hypothetical protein